ncbi:MAG: coenzyme F420-0:L-glutamate ligase [Candidatus Eremiobacteraeota bacterium]|nr:coenzyme F420-0:L-glutamate ligase [Candidatus Eremiobacteraeota bacterium]
MEKVLIYLVITLAGVVALFFIAWLIYTLVKKRVGDCEIKWTDGYLKIEEPQYSNDREASIEFALPLKNVGKQQCIIVDMIGRIHPEGDKYNFMKNRVHVYRSDNHRGDQYWEATLVKPGDTAIIKGEIWIESPDKPIRELMKELRQVEVDLYYKYYCRSPITYERKVLKIDFKDFFDPEELSGEDDYVTLDKGEQVLPIRTPLLVPGNDIYTIFEKYVKQHYKNGDIFAICESALAIMEGRVYYCEDINPGFIATHLNKFFKMDSSLSSPYSLEMGLREVGVPRMLFSMLMGVLGKIIGKDGMFYYFAGRAVATIDDCTGTLPPFDKYVVMGPGNPKGLVKEFREKTGVKLAVVDVNDLGRVDVLALSEPEDRQLVMKSLKTNPQGNANEQTPIALIRKN